MQTILEVFASNVKARRKELGYTLQEVARAADLSVPTVQNVELGKTWVGLATIEALSRALKCPETFLFRDPAMSKPTSKDIAEAVLDCLGLDVDPAVIRSAKLKKSAVSKSSEDDFTSKVPRDIAQAVAGFSKRDIKLLRNILAGWAKD